MNFSQRYKEESKCDEDFQSYHEELHRKRRSMRFDEIRKKVSDIWRDLKEKSVVSDFIPDREVLVNIKSL